MKRFGAAIVCWGILAAIGSGCASRQTGPRPFDVLQQSYAPYTDPADPLAFPMKVKSLVADEQMFWRGGRDLFYRWCGTNCGDWLADPSAYVTSHGDLHLGNIGTYPPAGAPLGTLAFGPVDFDDSARLPYQIELLQGLVTLRLAAVENRLRLRSSQKHELATTVVEAYCAARAGEPGAAKRIADDPDVKLLFAGSQQTAYATTIDRYTDGAGIFRPVVTDELGEPKEILRPVAGIEESIAAALAQAVANSLSLKQQVRFSDAAGARVLIRAVALRTRIASSGSQGLRKYLVLMRAPLRDYDGDAILHVKEQIPSAAERAGIISRDPRTPGRRCAEDTSALTEPAPLLNGWCEMDGRSYALMLREPWSEELSPKQVKTYVDLLRTARLWATVAGAAHRRAAGGSDASAIDSKLTPTLATRAESVLKAVEKDFARFRADPRVKGAANAAAVQAN